MTMNGNSAGGLGHGYYFEDLSVGMEARYAKKITDKDVLELADMASAIEAVTRLLTELLEMTGELTEAYFASLDMTALGMPVDWAGPEPAPVAADAGVVDVDRHVDQRLGPVAPGPPAGRAVDLDRGLGDTGLLRPPGAFLGAGRPRTVVDKLGAQRGRHDTCLPLEGGRQTPTFRSPRKRRPWSSARRLSLARSS